MLNKTHYIYMCLPLSTLKLKKIWLIYLHKIIKTKMSSKLRHYNSEDVFKVLFKISLHNSRHNLLYLKTILIHFYTLLYTLNKSP